MAITSFLRKHWITLLLLVASLLVVRWIVTTQRYPGSMTVVEAQAMDMTTMKAPLGTQPVAVVRAQREAIVGAEAFPGTVAAFADEEAIARIPGRVTLAAVYPGDEVRPGQLLARLDADEYAAQAASAGARSRAASAMVTTAEQQVQRMMAARLRMVEEASAMSAAAQRADAELDSERASLSAAEAEATRAEAEHAEFDAEADYKAKAAARERVLYEKGASSLDEAQAAEAEAKSAAARRDAHHAHVQVTKKEVLAARSRVRAMELAVAEAKAKARSAAAAVEEADRELAASKSEVGGRRAEQGAMAADARGAIVISGYRELRALDRAVVTERLVSPGTLVEPGDILYRLKVIHKVRVQARLPEQLFAVVRTGTPVTITSGGVKREAKVTSVFAASDPMTRTFTVEAVVENADKKLLVGAFASVLVKSGSRPDALVVPRSALFEDENGDEFVWVMKRREGGASEPTDYTCTMHPEVSNPGPGICPICKMDLVPREAKGEFYASRVKVETGLRNTEKVEILSGVSEGDAVIYAGHKDLFEGAAVAEVPWDKSGPAQLPPGSGSSGHEHGSGTPTQEDHSGHGGAAGGGNSSGGMTDDEIRKQAAARFPSDAKLWTCPMDPEVVADKPGSCPICKMDLIPYER